MNRFYKLLLTSLFLLVASWKLSAQVQFLILPQTINATVNQQVSFDVKVKNFTQIEGYSYSYFFDPTKLEFVGFGPDTNSPTFKPTQGTTPGVSPQLLANGKITVLWVLNGASAESLPDNTTTMTLVFKSKVTGAVALGFSDDPLAPEVLGPSGELVSSFSPSLNTLGGGGGSPCSPDVTPPSFSSCPSNINLTTTTTCATATWAAPTATDACGTATVTQIAGTASGTCFPIGTTTVTYRATDAANNSTTCSFTVTVTQDNGSTGCVNTWTYPTGLGSDLAVVLSEEVVEKVNDQATMRVMVSNFNKILGLGFSLKWDATKLQYIGIKDDKFNLDGASINGSLNLNQKDNGILGFNWDDPTTKGITKANQTVIFEIIFKKLSADDALVSFNNTPVDFNAVIEINNDPVDISNFTRINGKVKLCGNPPPTPCVEPTYDKSINIKKVTISANGEACVDVVVNDFSNIDGLEAVITWDAAKLQFQRIESTGITLVNDVDFVYFKAENKVKISWVTTTPVTIANGQSIFRLCFQAVGGVGSTAIVEFVPPIEIISGVPKNNVTSADGSVSIKATPTVTASNSGLCNGVGTVSAFPTGSNYSYYWTTPSGAKTGQTLNITAGGTYKVTVVDNTTCLSGKAETVVQVGVAPTISSLVQDETGLVATSTGLVTWYLKSDPNTPIFTGNPLTTPQAGFEYVAKVGASTCTASKEILAIGVNADITNVKCGGESTGRIILSIVGTTGLNYKWNTNNATTKDLSNLSVGNYTITITTPNGSVNAVRSFTITEPNPLKFVGTPTIKNSPDGAINVTLQGGTGNLSYSWTGVGDNPSYTWPTPPPFTGAITKDLTGLEPGTYTLIVTDANGCTATVSQRLDVQPITVKLKGNTVTHTSCGLNNGAFEIIAEGGSGAFNFTWSGATQIANTPVATNVAAGPYNVTVTDKKYNLVTSFSSGLNVNASVGPIVQIDKVTDAGDNCKGAIDIAVTSGTSPYTYKWSGATPNIPAEQDPTGLCEGTYSVTITDSKGCFVVKNDIIVAGAARPCPTITKLTQPNCPETKDGSIEMVVPGGKSPYVFVWKKDGKTYPATTKDLAGLSAGKYSITVTDALGKTCSKEDIILASKSDIQVAVSVTDPIPNNAKNGAALLTVTGGSGNYEYLWEGNVSTSNSASNLKTANYTVTISDKNSGCSIVKTFPVGDPASVEIVIRSVYNGVNVRCFGMCNGIAEVKNVGDATPPLKYKWTNGDTSRIAKGLCVGTHKVTVTDSNKENFEGTVTIIGPEKLDLSIIVDVKEKSATAVLKGGTSPYNYRWHDNSTDYIVKDQPVGRVYLMVTDANGCETFKDAYIGEENTKQVCLDSSTPILTANNDSYNDALDIYCLEDYGKINTLEIFNRWGQIVFTKTNYENRSWTGTDINGKPLPTGSYFYVIEVTKSDGQKEKGKGSFTILNEN